MIQGGYREGKRYRNSFPTLFLGEHLYIVDCFYSRFLIPWVVE